jgi:ribosomal protein S18 acetylase RimI-like enzyme
MADSLGLDDVIIRLFRPPDQEPVRALILAGLEARFGILDLACNPDLDQIAQTYRETVLVAERAGGVIGCGMLYREDGSDLVGRIARVSMAGSVQGLGLGRRICEALIEHARQRDFHKLLVETNETWSSALGLYHGLGFTEMHRVAAPDHECRDVHMALDMIAKLATAHDRNWQSTFLKVACMNENTTITASVSLQSRSSCRLDRAL